MEVSNEVLSEMVCKIYYARGFYVFPFYVTFFDKMFFFRLNNK